VILVEINMVYFFVTLKFIFSVFTKRGSTVAVKSLIVCKIYFNLLIYVTIYDCKITERIM